MKDINIENRKARFEYELLDKYEAGIKLTGSEIKSLRNGNANIGESFCFISNGEMFIKNMYIAQYTEASYTNHDERRDRKLLLHKSEIRKISEKMKNQSLTIVATKLFINKKGIAKLNIAVSRGKKTHDKRNTIRERDMTRDMDRKLKL